MLVNKQFLVYLNPMGITSVVIRILVVAWTIYMYVYSFSPYQKLFLNPQQLPI